jgi:hypothetical protein
MTELKIEHVLMLAIVALMLYHFMGSCGCRGNGFSVGGDKEPFYCGEIISEKNCNCDNINNYCCEWSDLDKLCKEEMPTPTPSPKPPPHQPHKNCWKALQTAGCKQQGGPTCDMCAGQHQTSLLKAGCDQKDLYLYCKP